MVPGGARADGCRRMPHFRPVDGVCEGKTGTGYTAEADGRRGKRQFGRFVGWATRGRQGAGVRLPAEEQQSGRQRASAARTRDDLLEAVGRAGRRMQAASSFGRDAGGHQIREGVGRLSAWSRWWTPGRGTERPLRGGPLHSLSVETLTRLARDLAAGLAPHASPAPFRRRGPRSGGCARG